MRHKHNLSHYRLLTGDMGNLYPVGLVEVLPSDTFQHSMSAFIRFSPMAAPVMHPITVRIHHFFVPNRILWPESEDGGFEKFITGGEKGDNVSLVPTIKTSGTKGDLFDYMALPQKSGIDVSALPIRAYNLIFNEYYRDQDLVDARLMNDVTIPKIAWEKDYLTMARPWAQKGPSITIPLGDTAPVSISGSGGPSFTGGGLTGSSQLHTDSTNSVKWDQNAGGAGAVNWQDPQLTGVANLAQAQAVDINTFRKAFALQRFAEARARYGSRYTEYLRYLGVKSSDARLMRPEFLAGGKARVSLSEVLQTANEATPGRFGVGDMYGHGIASTRSNAYRRTFEEHGYVLSLLSLRPKAMYLNGMDRHWLRRDREDFWQRELEHVGQQEVWQGEVFVTQDDDQDKTHGTFGYQDRYREYREEPARVSAEFRDQLKYWHMGRDFSTAPVLNASFVECDATKRIFNVQSEHALWIACQHKLVARRLVTANASGRIL